MQQLIYLLFIVFFMVSCSRENELPNISAKYTFEVEGWESLGSQTLVMLDATNPSSLAQKIAFKVEVTNTMGRVFTKDTRVQFEQDERKKNFDLIVDTEGEIERVNVVATMPS